MAADAGELQRVGVLGGMGVEATIALMQRIHGATATQDDQDHAPLIVDMNPQVPSRIRHVIEKDGPDPGPVLAEMAVRLELAGARALAMPCNTAHLYASHIEGSVSIPLLNMPELACTQAARTMKRGETVGILESPATNSTGLFKDLFEKSGMLSIFPEEESEILASIRRIKKEGPGSADVELLEREAQKLQARGAAGVIIGCSEFSLMSQRVGSPIPVLDTLDVLVDEIIAFSGAQAKL